MTGPVRIGIAGLGMAASVMVPAMANHPHVQVAGAADPDPVLRERFGRDFAVPVTHDALALAAQDDIDALYIATPHQYHAAHAIAAASHGKHAIVEKPMALTLDECDAMIDAFARSGTTLVVGHTFSFDEPVRVMRALIAGGTLGPLAMVSMWNFTDFLYRPRRPEELDTRLGGGILFNQLPHQVDIARLLAGTPVRSVRAMAGALDPQRTTEGHCTAFIEFASGAAASIVYSGYDHFDTDELHGWIGATGRRKTPRHGQTRHALAHLAESETSARHQRYGYGSTPGHLADTPDHQPHCGLLIATCARGDIRTTPAGLAIYRDGGLQQVRLAPSTARYAGRTQVLDELVRAVRGGRRPVHDGAFGRATLEACLAIQHSSATRQEVVLPGPSGHGA